MAIIMPQKGHIWGSINAPKRAKINRAGECIYALVKSVHIWTHLVTKSGPRNEGPHKHPKDAHIPRYQDLRSPDRLYPKIWPNTVKRAASQDPPGFTHY